MRKRTALLTGLALLALAPLAGATDCNGTSIVWRKCTVDGHIWIKMELHNSSSASETAEVSTADGHTGSTSANSGMTGTCRVNASTGSTSITVTVTGTDPNPCTSTSTVTPDNVSLSYSPCIR